MKLLTYIVLASLVVTVSACSSSYTPAADANGEKIFQEACAECHKADNKDAPGMIFALSTNNATMDFIAKKLQMGSLKMPKFPNITGDKLKQLSDYVLTHNLQP
jgi:cytochrome c551